MKAYGLRSDVVHHDRSISSVELLTEFLMVVFRFFITLLRDQEKYQTREEFFAAVKLKRLGG